MSGKEIYEDDPYNIHNVTVSDLYHEEMFGHDCIVYEISDDAIYIDQTKGGRDSKGSSFDRYFFDPATGFVLSIHSNEDGGEHLDFITQWVRESFSWN